MTTSYGAAEAALKSARATGATSVTVSVDILADLLIQLGDQRHYWRLTERNDYEGETWHFYVKYEENRDAIKFLEAKIKERREMGYNDYCFGVIYTSMTLLGALPDDTSYMRTHTIINRPLDLVSIAAVDWSEDPLYNGGIRDFMVPLSTDDPISRFGVVA